MTAFLFLGGFFLGLVLTVVRHPIYGLYTYFFTFYMAPGHGWLRHDIPGLRYLFIIAVVTVLATLRLPADPDRPPWYKTGAGKLLLLFVLYNWLQIQWAVDRDWQMEGAILFTKHLIIFCVIYTLANSLDRIKDIAIANVIGCGWFGYQALGAGGGRLEKIGGAVAGSNELSQHIAAGLLFGGFLFMFLKGAKRWAVFAVMPLVANTLVLTLSRGGFLGFVGGGLAGYLAVPKQYKLYFKLVSILGVVLISMLAHQQLIDRFMDTYRALTTDEEQLDGSAAGRIDIAKAGIQIALDHPFGAGFRGTGVLSPQYMDESLLGRGTGKRGAHNTLAAVVAEQGFPGLLLYVLTILWVIRVAFRVKRLRVRVETQEITELKMCAAFLFAALMAMYGAGNFSNNIDLETQYWCLALLASVYELHKKTATSVIDENERRDTPSRETSSTAAAAGVHRRRSKR